MEVVLNHEQKPQGVFLALAEWEQLKHGINKASELYKLMDELSQKDIFDMDANEFAAHLAPVAKDTANKALDQGLYFSYPTGGQEPCSTFIHEYKNGRKVLIEVDSQTGKEHFIRNF